MMVQKQEVAIDEDPWAGMAFDVGKFIVDPEGKANSSNRAPQPSP